MLIALRSQTGALTAFVPAPEQAWPRVEDSLPSGNARPGRRMSCALDAHADALAREAEARAQLAMGAGA